MSFHHLYHDVVVPVTTIKGRGGGPSSAAVASPPPITGRSPSGATSGGDGSAVPIEDGTTFA
jgi:hypothetical protein